MMECPFCLQGMMWVMWIFWILLIILLGGGVCWVVSRLSGRNSSRSDEPEDPKDVLMRRYAAGELSDEEYERRRRKLKVEDR